MRHFLYKNGDEKVLKELYKYLREHKTEKAKLISVKENNPIRSLSANRFYWALINIVAIHTGHTRSEIEFMFKMAHHFEIVEYPSGKTEKIPKETHTSDTKEFSIICNRLVQWIREEFPQVIIPPTKEEISQLQEMEILNNYERVFSGY